MAYAKKTWVSGETPLSAENMNNIENGIADAHEDIIKLNTKKQNEISLKSNAIKITCNGSTTAEGSITRNQLGISDNESIMFAHFGLAYTTGVFYQGLDISFSFGTGTGVSGDNAILYKIYNNNANTFTDVEFIARCLVCSI